MENGKYTVEELMLDEGFLDFCLHADSAYRPYWEHVIEQNPAQQAVFNEARNNIKMLGGNLSEAEILMQIEKVHNLLNSPRLKETTEAQVFVQMEEEEPAAPSVTRRPFKKILMYGVAACLVLILSLYFIVPSLSKAKEQTTDTFISVFNSAQGERKRIELPDGTVVVLNTNSQIAINNDYNQTKREVELKGEAFFEVAKDQSKPFIVHSNNFSTTAIGTAFYVHARSADKQYKVDLLEGKVKLNAKEKSVFLSQGEQADWKDSNAVFIKSGFDTQQLEQWVKGKISFNKTSMGDALRQLEKWYAVDIEIKRKDLLKQSVSGDYENVSLENILKVLCFTFSSTYTYTNNTVIIE